MRTLFLAAWAALVLLPSLPLQAQDADVAARIRAEGMERSQVMETLHWLTDVHGPRLTGSPALENAGHWVLDRMTSWGLENAHREAWDWGRGGWENERLAAHLVRPVRDPLTAEVLAWTSSTNGPVTARAFHLTPPSGPTEAELEDFFASVTDSVRGRIVLVGAVNQVPTLPDPRPLRMADEDARETYDPANLPQPRNYGRRGGGEAREGALSSGEVATRVNAFLLAQDVPVRIDPSGLDQGLIRAFANRTYDPAQMPPTVVLRTEDYGRITRLLASGLPVELEFDIANRLYPERDTEYNYVAEIPGTDLADEVVIVGGHLDSWHAATGTTDNGTGTSVMMEAARILQTIFEETGTRPRRTVRVALWTGEEQGLLGSQAYVEQHYGTFEAPKADYGKVAAYFNIDAGTGRVRGATVFGPETAAAVLEEALAPLEDLGVAGARPTFSRALGGSDHTAFNQAGLPGVSLGQDPIQYFTHTWHTNVDNYERALEDDLKQAAVVAATVAYVLATRDELLPRFSADEMPAVR